MPSESKQASEAEEEEKKLQVMCDDVTRASMERKQFDESRSDKRATRSDDANQTAHLIDGAVVGAHDKTLRVHVEDQILAHDGEAN